ncbi:hypothetical protein AB0D67_37775 [Streptosporangium sp. NPDC048047]|uniref:hypothetical protein n=1 Tax=Streptosporangium sp. NPDC048047 TaxID=3155748 RepID=UPI00341AC423
MISNPASVRWPRRWPLALLALPAGVATWSGWVGLGKMTGFGPVQLLPGIADDIEINSAVTLPIGVEAYAAFALAAWLTSAPVAPGTRKFARASALGALGLGMFGQIAYHLLEVAGRTQAPVPVTVLVSCLPVLVLGLGAALAHMLHRDRLAASVEIPEKAPEETPNPVDPDPGRGARPEDPADVHPEVHPAPADPVHPVDVNPGAPGAAPAPAPDPIPAPRPEPLPVGATSEPASAGDPVEVHPEVHPAPADLVHPGAPDAPAPGAAPSDLLAAQTQQAPKVRIALGVLGEDATAGEVSAWLSDRGHPVKVETIRSTLRRERARHAAAASGPVASVTPLRRQK